MATKTFSGRADEAKLARADALTQRVFGLSFGQYCATVLLDLIDAGEQLPQASDAEAVRQGKIDALRSMRERSARFANPRIAEMSDAQIKDLIASRYE